MATRHVVLIFFLFCSDMAGLLCKQFVNKYSKKRVIVRPILEGMPFKATETHFRLIF